VFIGEGIVFLQIHKTASTHIASLLQQMLGGEIRGKHKPAPPDLLAEDPLVLASIRNPWDWYVSLWAFGASGRGALRTRVIRQNRSADRDDWVDVYRNSGDADAFRRWLRMVHDPDMAPHLREEYLPAAERWGFFTHRYLNICWRDPMDATDNASDVADLVARDGEQCYVDEFVRQEDIGRTLTSALEPFATLTRQQRRMIASSGRSNASIRPLPLSDYYDKETADLVRDRDGLIVEKFGYPSPC